MLSEFKAALCKRQNLEVLKETLCAETERQCDKQRDAISSSYRTAKFILWALREDKDTEQYQLARSYLERYSRETGEPIIEPQTEPDTLDQLFNRNQTTDERSAEE